MKWLTSNLLLLLIPGLLLVFGSFVRVRPSVVKPDWRILGVGLALLVVCAVGAVQVFFGTPGQVDTIVEKPSDNKPVIPRSALDRLRLPWSTNSVADWPAAETLADISQIAYLPPHEAEKSYRELGFTTVMPVVQSSMIGYVITGEDVTVVAFRGTDFAELSDWLTNLRQTTAETPHGRVHKGFFNAYKSMKSQVNAILHERNTKHLWVTGHSLGGALALVCAYDLEAVEQRELAGVITFGQPMVAQQEFADYIDHLLVGRYARFVNRSDIVPKVPSSHVACGSLVWFTEHGLERSVAKLMVYGAAADSPDTALPVAGARGDVEITPLTDAEFEAFQQQLRQEKAERDELSEGVVMSSGLISSAIDDHSMTLYLHKIRTLLGITPVP